MPDGGGFQLVVDAQCVVTADFAAIDRPELAMKVTSPAGIDDAKRLLLGLAGYIVSTNARIGPGDRFDLDGQELTLEDTGAGVLTVRPVRPASFV